jgi:hypothetical protein
MMASIRWSFMREAGRVGVMEKSKGAKRARGGRAVVHFMAPETAGKRGGGGTPGLPLAGVRNLGPVSARLLAEVGIVTRTDLAAAGAVGACERLMARGERVSLVLAYAIEGALMECDWRALPHEFRSRLVVDFRAAQRRHGAGARR